MMTPVRTKFDARYSGPGAGEVPWTQVDQTLAAAELYWLTTVRDDGRPHVCPLIGLWFDQRAWFTTGAEEQKASNLAVHEQVALTTGTNTWAAGLDVVVEGAARRTTDRADLERAAAGFLDKYGEAWAFSVEGDGLSAPDAGLAEVYVVAPAKVLAFGKDPHSQTAYLFA